MAAPTRVSSTASAFNTSTTPKTVTGISVQAGDLIVVSSGSENGNSTASTPTSTGYTFVLDGTAGSGGTECEANSWSAIAPSTATISVSCSVSGGGQWGMEVTVWRNHGGLGNVFAGDSNTTSSAPSGSITTLSDNSAIDCVVADWNATATSPTYRNLGDTPVQDAGAVSGGAYTIYCWHNPDAGTAGAKTIGLTAPNMRWAMVAVEIRGTSSGTQYAASGTAASSSTATGSAGMRAVAAAVAAAASIATGSVTSLLPSSGAVPVSSVVSGTPGGRLVATGSASATSTAAGAVTSLLPTSGSVVVTSTVAGSAGLQGGAQTYPASGTAASTSAAAGTIALRAVASGAAGSTSLATGVVTSRLPAGGVVTAASTAAGDAGLLPAGSLAAQGTVVADSLADGVIHLRAAASGAAICSSSATGSPTARLVMSGAVPATSTADGTLAARLSVFGIVAATSSAAGSAAVYDPSIPPLPIDGVSLTVSVDARGLSVVTESRSLEVTT